MYYCTTFYTFMQVFVLHYVCGIINYINLGGIMAKKNINKGAAPGGFYFLTYVGALVYFIQKSDGFWEVVFSFLQAMVWPAYLIHRVFELLRI